MSLVPAAMMLTLAHQESEYRMVVRCKSTSDRCLFNGQRSVAEPMVVPVAALQCAIDEEIKSRL